MPKLWLWVEGPGDVRAAPVLVRRILSEWLKIYDWKLIHPIQVRSLRAFERDKEKFVKYLRKRKDVNAVLVLLDLDKGCAAELAPSLARELEKTNPPVPMAIVFAVREYEAWFLASAQSLWKRDYPGDPERPRDAKGEIKRLFEPRYRPTTFQAYLSGKMSLEQAVNNSRSFRRLVNALKQLVEAGRNGRVVVTPRP